MMGETVSDKLAKGEFRINSISDKLAKKAADKLSKTPAGDFRINYGFG